MAKKKEAVEEKTGIKRIDYLTLIESLSNKAFDYFVDNIINDLNFKVLKRDDLRKIDIEEKILYRIEFLYYRSLRLSDEESVNKYVLFIKQYLEGFISCKDDSRAAVYNDRASELADKLLAQEGSEDDLHDLVLLFIGLFKSYKEAGMSEIADLDLGVEESDAKLVRWISEGDEMEPPVKGKFKVAKNPVKGMTDFDKEFVCITTLLCACVLMQEAGLFEEDE